MAAERSRSSTAKVPSLPALLLLSDAVARNSIFTLNFIPGHKVALKTGTTNDNKDAWLIGYTPNIVVGAWAGNNENTPMIGMSGTIIAPMWRALMDEALKTVTNESFIDPIKEDSYEIKPIIRGKWQGGISTINYTNTQSISNRWCRIVWRFEFNRTKNC